MWGTGRDEDRQRKGLENEEINKTSQLIYKVLHIDHSPIFLPVTPHTAPSSTPLPITYDKGDGLSLYSWT